MIARRIVLVAALTSGLTAYSAQAQTTGSLSILSVGGGSAGTITTVGGCTVDPCFQTTTEFTFFAAPVGGGVASFRAITLADLPDTLATDIELTAAISTHAADANAHHVPTVDTDTTCLDAGVECLFAASSTEGGAATSVTEGAVTAHEAALSITESQISDLAHTVDTDTFAGYVATGSDLGVVTGTAGATDDCAKWNVDGDLVSAGAACGAGGGGIGGSTGATDDAILRADGTGGATVQAGAWTMSDAGLATIPTGATAGLCFGVGADTCIWELSNGVFQLSSVFFTVPLSIGSVGGDQGVGFGHTANRGALLSSQIASTLFANVRPARGNNDGLGSGGNGDLRLIANTVSGLGQTSTETTLYVEQVNAPAIQTCADSGDGNPGTLVASVSALTFKKITNSDPDGCSLTFSETGATDGQRLEVIVVSNAGGTVTIADLAGIQEAGSGCAMAINGASTWRYIGTAWIMTGCEPTN